MKRKNSVPDLCMSLRKKVMMIWAPLLISLLWSAFSFNYDIEHKSKNMFMRSGAILVIVGAWIAYCEGRNAIRTKKDGNGGMNLYFDPDETLKKYTWISLAYIVIGTAINSYGDILHKLLYQILLVQ